MTFILGSQEYAIEFIKVQETCRFDFVKHLIDVPSFIKGVINYKGEALPIIDLRNNYALAHQDTNNYTEVIIVNLANRLIGVAVDCIAEVTLTKKARILTAPVRVSDIEPKFLYGLVPTDDRMLILVDIEKLVAHKENAIIKMLNALHNERIAA
jgi:purine-binding chemotaxis protein CheW